MVCRLILWLVLALAHVAPRVSAFCNQTYELVPGGVVFITGLDWVGNDITARTNVDSDADCIAFCSAVPGAVVWSLELSGNRECWCKSQANGNPVERARDAGPLPSHILATVPTGAYRTVNCANGYQPPPQLCQADGTWLGAMFNCNPQCSMSYVNTPYTGLQTVLGVDWSSNDVLATPGVLSPYACFQLCLKYATDNNKTIGLWEWDTNPNYACWCKDKFAAKVTPGPNKNRYTGVMPGGEPVINIPYPGVLTTICPTPQPGVVSGFPPNSEWQACGSIEGTGGWGGPPINCQCTLPASSDPAAGLVYVMAYSWSPPNSNELATTRETATDCRFWCSADPQHRLWTWDSVTLACTCQSHPLETAITNENTTNLCVGPLAGLTIGNVPLFAGLGTECPLKWLRSDSFYSFVSNCSYTGLLQSVPDQPNCVYLGKLGSFVFVWSTFGILMVSLVATALIFGRRSWSVPTTYNSGLKQPLLFAPQYNAAQPAQVHIVPGFAPPALAPAQPASFEVITANTTPAPAPANTSAGGTGMVVPVEALMIEPRESLAPGEPKPSTMGITLRGPGGRSKYLSIPIIENGTGGLDMHRLQPHLLPAWEEMHREHEAAGGGSSSGASTTLFATAPVTLGAAPVAGSAAQASELDLVAARERNELPFWTSMEQIRIAFGNDVAVCVAMYRFSHGLLCALAICGLIATGFSQESASQWAFVGGFKSNARLVWVLMSVSLCLVFGGGFAVGWWLDSRVRTRMAAEGMSEEQVAPTPAELESERLNPKEDTTAYRVSRVGRLIASYLLVLAALILSGSTIIRLFQTIGSGSHSLLTTVLRAMLTTAFNLTFPVFAKFLTARVELPASVTTYRKHLLLKLYVFQTLNITTTISATLFADQYSVSRDVCYLNAIGETVLAQLISDFAIKFALDVVWPYVVYWKAVLSVRSTFLARIFAPPAEPALAALETSFDVFRESQSLGLRIFLALYGSMTCPVIAVFALLFNIVEAGFARYRLLRRYVPSPAGVPKRSVPVSVKSTRLLLDSAKAMYVFATLVWIVTVPTGFGALLSFNRGLLPTFSTCMVLADPPGTAYNVGLVLYQTSFLDT